MAQQSEAGIPRAGKRKWGYDPAQVDAFLERAHALYDSDGAQLTQRDIQNVSFDLTRGGYEVAQVDAALARLERAVVDKQTTWEISQHGRIAWKAKTEELYREIVRHLDRAEGERFGSGKPRTPSYDRKQVDKLSDQIADKAASELGLDGVSKKDVGDLDKITADFVSNSVFTQRKGKKGYDERQVDYFLNTCAQLLSRLESFDRIADYVTSGDDDASSSATPSSGAEAVDGVAPLFSPDAQYQRPTAPEADVSDAPQSYAPVVAEPAATPVAAPVAVAPAASAVPDRDAAAGAESFDALSQAEQSLFTPSPEPPVASPSVVLAGNAAAPVAAPVPAVSTPAVAPAVAPVVTPAPAAVPVQTVPAQPVAVAPATVPAQPAPVQPVPAQASPVQATTPVAQPVSFAPATVPVQTTVPVQPVTPAPVAAPVQAAPAPAVAPVVTPAQPVQPVQPAPSTYPTQPVSFAPTSQPVVQPSAAPAPAAPAPEARPVAPAPTAVSAEPEPTTGSLAALAHMAAVSQEFPAIDAPSFAPQMPRLDIPSVTSASAATPAPAQTPAPAPARASHAAHAAHAAPAPSPAPAPAAPANPFSLLSTDDGNLEIPNLSFPGIGDDEKKQQ